MLSKRLTPFHKIIYLSSVLLSNTLSMVRRQLSAPVSSGDKQIFCMKKVKILIFCEVRDNLAFVPAKIKYSLSNGLG
jgi:hypothetical protein